MTSSRQWLLVAVACACAHAALSAPAPDPKPQEPSSPRPYEYKYDVEDPEKQLFFGANESGDAQGKVVGGYRVLLPDGRLMVVEYTVDGDSGFVPKITFQNNYNPFTNVKTTTA